MSMYSDLIIIGTTVSEGILMMRTFALWNRNKFVMWLFLFMIVVSLLSVSNFHLH